MKIAAVIFWLALIAGIVGGWIANIYKLVTFTGEFGLLELARCIGIVAAPLGVVLGYVG